MIKVELVMPDSKGIGAEAMKLLRPDLLAFLREAVSDLTDLIKMKVSGKGRGKIYRRGAIYHQASAPGDPPARDAHSEGSQSFGSYADSWDWDTKEGPTYLDGRVGSKMFRAGIALGAMLEFGTRFIRPRPHVYNSVEEWKRNINRKIGRG